MDTDINLIECFQAYRFRAGHTHSSVTQHQYMKLQNKGHYWST